MNHAYSILRFQQELNRLKAFYIKKSSKNKTAAKISSVLNDIDLQNEETLDSLSTTLSKYRQILSHNYLLNCEEMLFNQVGIFMKYLGEDHQKMKWLKG